jgi:hypothetical protein
MLSHLDLEPSGLFVVAVAVVVLINVIAGWTLWSQFLLVDVGVGLCVGGAIATAALLVCFAIGVAMAVQEQIATVALLMGMVGGILFGSAYRSRGDEPPQPDDGPWDPTDDPGGDYAYPWWPEFERELRDYEAARSSEPVWARRGSLLRRLPFAAMTAKEKLHRVVERLSEPEAEQTLDYIERQQRRDPLVELLDNAPADDEPTTAEEEEGVQEARAEYGRGEVFTAEEIRREIA